MASNALPPLQALTPTDHGAIVVVVAYCFAGFTVVGAGARTAITVVQKQGFHRDDIGYFGGAVSIRAVNRLRPIANGNRSFWHSS
jgi:hypothetical protein